MTLVDYIGELIPLDSMVPEVQTMIAAIVLVFLLRLLVGGFLAFFEKVFR